MILTVMAASPGKPSNWLLHMADMHIADTPPPCLDHRTPGSPCVSHVLVVWSTIPSQNLGLGLFRQRMGIQEAGRLEAGGWLVAKDRSDDGGEGGIMVG